MPESCASPCLYSKCTFSAPRSQLKRLRQLRGRRDTLPSQNLMHSIAVPTAQILLKSTSVRFGDYRIRTYWNAWNCFLILKSFSFIITWANSTMRNLAINIRAFYVSIESWKHFHLTTDFSILWSWRMWIALNIFPASRQVRFHVYVSLRSAHCILSIWTYKKSINLLHVWSTSCWIWVHSG
jgi:hypothetical protein